MHEWLQQPPLISDVVFCRSFTQHAPQPSGHAYRVGGGCTWCPTSTRRIFPTPTTRSFSCHTDTDAVSIPHHIVIRHRYKVIRKRKGYRKQKKRSTKRRIVQRKRLQIVRIGDAFGFTLVRTSIFQDHCK